MHSCWYRSRKYIIGLDLETISGAGFTGLSTKSSDLLTLHFNGCDARNNASSVPDRVFCALNYDCVLNIQDAGIQLLDKSITIILMRTNELKKCKLFFRLIYKS